MERLRNKMLCDNCHKQDPIIKITVITNEKSISVYLCDKCLEKLKLNSPVFNDISSMYVEIIIGLLSEYLSNQTEEDELTDESESFSWESDEDDLLEFDTYENQFNNDESNRGKRQNGKLSGIEISIMNLQKRLDLAVKEENYEFAAKLRDRIIELKKGNE